MFHAVPEEVLEELLEAGPVRPNRSVDVDAEPRAGRSVDVSPTALEQVGEGDGLEVAELLALASQREEVLDQLVHAVVRAGHVFEVLAVTLLLDEPQPPLGDGERVPEVVAHHVGELLEPLVLPFQLVAAAPELPFALALVQRGLGRRREDPREELVGRVEGVRRQIADREGSVIAHREDHQAS